MKTLGIDPGTDKSGWCIFDGSTVLDSGITENAKVIDLLGGEWAEIDNLAIEMIASYGIAVGREVFETCVWIGRFKQAWRDPDRVALVYRRDVKLHLCGTAKAKDSNIRQALIDLFPPTGGGAVGQIGTKSQPGPLYGVSSHVWPALAVAVTWLASSAPVVRARPFQSPQPALL